MKDMPVRSKNAAIRALVSQASGESATFQSMVETIRASQGIVYVEPGDCGHGVRACLVHVTGAGTHRILFVKVDVRKADRKLMASIGHELRHAIEVLGDPSVKTSIAMFFFYVQFKTTAIGTVESTLADTTLNRKRRRQP